MIRIADLKLPLGREEILLKKRAAKQLHIPVEQITSWRIFKKSLDARKKDRIHYVCVVDVAVDNETKVLAGVKGDKDVSKTPDLSIISRKANARWKNARWLWALARRVCLRR